MQVLCWGVRRLRFSDCSIRYVDSAGRALVGLVTDAVFGGLDESDIRRAVTALGAKSADMRQSIYGLQEVLARLAKETERA